MSFAFILLFAYDGILYEFELNLEEKHSGFALLSLAYAQLYKEIPRYCLEKYNRQNNKS